MTHQHEGSHQSEHASHHGTQDSKSSKVTFSLSFTPGKLFFGGFLLGVLIMAIPTAIFATKAFGGSKGLSQGQIDALAGQIPSVAENAIGAVPGELKPVSDQDHVRGNKDAAVTIVEYSDLECPFCQRFHPTVQEVVNGYDGKVNWVYRHFPLGFHANAQKEAEASECAADIGGNEAFWSYIDAIFARTTANGTGFALDKLVPLAKELGMDEKKFQECLDSGKYTEKVNKDFTEGQAAGVEGTPGGFIVSKDGRSAPIRGAVPAEQLKADIDKLLQ
ncbi:DsbA family protein [Candidatus Uhrbacteria bacterium]|nr:DsbA family protein [Candidatus Uhrbacteria bacterium]